MSELGKVGQKYEDRRTKRVGTLMSRDEKYKTLLMQTDEGKTFNISYSTFKSNWRSCSEPVTTVEQAMEEIEIPDANISTSNVTEDLPVEEQSKPKRVRVERNIGAVFTDYAEVVMKYAESFYNPLVSIKVEVNKRTYLLKYKGRTLMNISALCRAGKYSLWISEPDYKNVKFTEAPLNVLPYTGFLRCIRIDVPAEKLLQYLEDLKPVMIEHIVDARNLQDKEED